MTEREFAIWVVKRLQESGYRALWAGGCVRDELLGLLPKDYDVATDARPEEVRKLFPRTIAVGASFGVVEVLGPRQEGDFLRVQVATFRSDVSYSDGRHPDAVVFSSPREDALRRDFTINGMFCDPLTGEIIDYVGGQEDLRRKVLRAIGDPHQRFAEDKLRLLRAVRIAARFGLEIEPATYAAIRAMAPQITVVSAERIAQELKQLLVHPNRVRAVALMAELGLLAAIFPELADLSADAGLWQHTLQVLDHLGASPPFPLALAALLHDIGRGDALRAAALAEDIGARLRLSKEETSLTAWLIRHQHSLDGARALRTSTLKKLLASEHVGELLAFLRAERLATGSSLDDVEFCEQRLHTWTEADLNPPPLLTGHDLMQMGLKPGPVFKQLLDAVRDAQLDEVITTREEAIQLVEKLRREM